MKTELNLKQRARGLIELIEDGFKLGFDSLVIKDYENQLSKIQAELNKEKEAKEKFKESSKGGIKNEK